MKSKKEKHEKILFPTRILNKSPLCKQRYNTPDKLVLRNRDLNSEQRLAVFGVLSAVSRPSPYLIYGPPGTGKTVTVVESIIQTLKASLITNPKILVCAPSNAATDVLCERLSTYLLPSEMIRINAYSRAVETVPDVVKRYSYYSSTEDGYTFPPLELVKGKKIVVMTVTSAGKLSNNGISDHFTHVFLDEAGHSIEMEAISCFIGCMVIKDPIIVLAGDPKQLGPIVRSESARTFGMELSLLERLSKLPIYQPKQTPTECPVCLANNDHWMTVKKCSHSFCNRCIAHLLRMESCVCPLCRIDFMIDDCEEFGNGPRYDSRVLTKLVENYRSHPNILYIPNKAFYESELIASAPIMISHNLNFWEHLPKRGFPLIFHGVEGQDNREGNSPSWYNSEECQVVKYYVDLLVKDTRSNRCKLEEIGVVTPYHKQAKKIRRLMKASDYGDVTVGSVEEYQGNERRVIIISTVRSSVDFLDYDNKHKLGFLSNPKRFNVAVTRAQALLIVIGNPKVLERDIHWRTLLHFCIENDAYIGCDYNPSRRENIDEAIDNTISGLATFKISDDRESTNGRDNPSAMTEQENPEWRFEE